MTEFLILVTLTLGPAVAAYLLGEGSRGFFHLDDFIAGRDLTDDRKYLHEATDGR